MSDLLRLILFLLLFSLADLPIVSNVRFKRVAIF